jgi:hypothetical protein
MQEEPSSRRIRDDERHAPRCGVTHLHSKARIQQRCASLAGSSTMLRAGLVDRVL